MYSFHYATEAMAQNFKCLVFLFQLAFRTTAHVPAAPPAPAAAVPPGPQTSPLPSGSLFRSFLFTCNANFHI